MSATVRTIRIARPLLALAAATSLDAMAPAAATTATPPGTAPSVMRNGPGLGCAATSHAAQAAPGARPDPALGLANAAANRDITSVAAVFKSTRGTFTTQFALPPGQPSARVPVFTGDRVRLGPATGRVWNGDIVHGEVGAEGVAGQVCAAPSCRQPDGQLFGLMLQGAGTLYPNPDNVPAPGMSLLGSAQRSYVARLSGSFGLVVNQPAGNAGRGQLNVPLTVTPRTTPFFQAFGAMSAAYAATAPRGFARYRHTTYMGPAEIDVGPPASVPALTLDAEGAKAVPNACMACHGGRFDASGHWDGASLLPLDPTRMHFAPNGPFSRSAQEEAVRRINELVLRSRFDHDPEDDPIADWINAAYEGRVGQPYQVARDDAVPAAWSADRELYQSVVRPHCAGCHMAIEGMNFRTAVQFRSLAASIRTAVCATRSMPHSQPGLIAFWASDAPETLQRLLIGPQPCPQRGTTAISPCRGRR